MRDGGNRQAGIEDEFLSDVGARGLFAERLMRKRLREVMEKRRKCVYVYVYLKRGNKRAIHYQGSTRTPSTGADVGAQST